MMQTQQRDPSEDEPSTHSERAPGRMLIWTEALKFLGVSKPKELMPAYAPSRQRTRRLKDDSDPCFPTYKVMLSRDKTVRRFARARLFASGLGSVVKIPYSGEGRSVMMHLQFWQSFYNRAPMEPQRILCVLQNCLDAGGFPDPCGRYRLLSMGEEDPDSPSESDNYDY